MKIDLGNLTEEETVILAGDCLAYLPLDKAIKIVKEIFTGDDREELLAQLEDEEEEEK